VGACRFFSVLVMAYFERRAFAGIVPMAGQCLLAKFKTGGGATGTIRPSTSPRMPTSGFEGGPETIHGVPWRPRRSILK
jgi:hypothetical protein